ncbi:hypothetical protein LINPERPRIM_LOCUS28721 [Linum perenne]
MERVKNRFCSLLPNRNTENHKTLNQIENRTIISNTCSIINYMEHYKHVPNKEIGTCS